jgi:hypothetical protein
VGNAMDKTLDLGTVLHRVTDAMDLLPCGAEHSFPAQLRRDSFALRERAVSGRRPSGELVAEAELLLGRISEYLDAIRPGSMGRPGGAT